jgi:hypothetical protein
MNTALAALASLAVFYDENYTDNDENKPENEDVNENKPVNHNVGEPPAAAE